MKDLRPTAQGACGDASSSPLLATGRSASATADVVGTSVPWYRATARTSVRPPLTARAVLVTLALTLPLTPARLRSRLRSQPTFAGPRAETSRGAGAPAVERPAALAASCPGADDEPAPVRDLEPMSLRYQGTFSAAERTMPVTSAVVVSPHAAGGWAVAERAMLPRGLAVDSARLDARSLVPRERITQQGPTRITLRFADDEARGTIDAAGQTRPIRAALCGHLVGDGAGAFLVIGRLPLAAGYHATIRHLDLQTAQTTLKQLVVLGIERVSVPAGRFDAWKVQVTEEGMVSPTTIWVDEASRVPVKFSASQGAVTIAMELAR